MTKDGLNAVMERIHTDRDIVTSAKIRAEASERGKIVKLRPVAAVLCAVMLMCGVTVSAVKFGWIEQLFGDSAELITENIDKYKVKIGNVKIEKAEGVPYSFTVGDVISDGSSLYINLFIGGLDIESKYDFAFSADTDPYGEPTQTVNWLLDASGNACVIFSPESGVEKNDKIEFTLTDCTGQKAPPEPLADISFEILSDITDMTKRIEVNQTAEFIYSDLYEKGIDPYKQRIFIKTAEISPLRYVIKGEFHGRPRGSYICPGNIYLILKNGKKIAFDPNGGYMLNHGDEIYYATIEKRYDTVLDLDTVKAVEIGGITVDI